jgi:hypothetical protein
MSLPNQVDVVGTIAVDTATNVTTTKIIPKRDASDGAQK